MSKKINPFDWLSSAQNWFTRTERSSGFRPYLIFLILLIGFALSVFWFFPNQAILVDFVMKSLYVSTGVFIVLFVIKCFQDPNFCRSEKHVQTMKRIEMMEQKGDTAPTVIDTNKVELSSRPDHEQLPPPKGGDMS